MPGRSKFSEEEVFLWGDMIVHEFVDTGCILKKMHKFINLDFRLLQYSRQRGSLDRMVSGNGQFERSIREVFLKPDVAPLLPHDDPSVPPQSIDDLPR
jgi:hypothetical protein